MKKFKKKATKLNNGIFAYADCSISCPQCGTCGVTGATVEVGDRTNSGKNSVHAVKNG